MKLPNTAKALAEYDRTSPERSRLWQEAQTDADVVKAQKAERAAELLLGEAFYQDTRAFNSHDNCLLMGGNVTRLRGWVEKDAAGKF